MLVWVHSLDDCKEDAGLVQVLRKQTELEEDYKPHIIQGYEIEYERTVSIKMAKK